MGVLARYKYITNYGIQTEDIKPYTPAPKRQREYVPPDAKLITLADLDKRSKEYVTAHDLRDYRRTAFNLVLLPSVELSYDYIAKEVYGLGEYL